MPYKVTAPEASILRDLNIYKDNEGKITGYDRDSLVYVQGDVIADKDVAQVVKDAYDAGDPHTRGLIEYADGDVDETADSEHDVNQDLNLSDPDAPEKEKEFEQVQHPEDGPQQHKPAEKADAVDAPKEEQTVEPSADDDSAKKPKSRKKAAKKD